MKKTAVPAGCLMINISGVSLSAKDAARLRHPAVGGVILFAENFESGAQLRALCAAVRRAAARPLAIAADHEGGRVQRFRGGEFTRLPPMGKLGALFARGEVRRALRLARACGLVMGAELRAAGVDLSFTPVLDLAGSCAAIGDRAFSTEPAAVAALADALQRGLDEAGVACCGKHFPGHGGVRGDSHLTLPVDDRSLAQLRAADMLPFAYFSGKNAPAPMAAMMTAHIRYPKISATPATYSRLWLKKILRGEMGYRGLIVSDDLAMKGAAFLDRNGKPAARAEQIAATLAAGGDVVLVCDTAKNGGYLSRLTARRGKNPWQAVFARAAATVDDARYARAKAAVEELAESARRAPAKQAAKKRGR